ncbi:MULTISPECIES: hypothetical protein [unclassified Mesorhizobium]|uniref:hypothetical protein n=1 Tax=unclassified Mesorhizobium TaxID=325217 RepID=UPI0015E30A26|nr:MULTISPECIES: hypothetical protein [unclassified Mesorhizobium]UCI11727.1 hypothetical protein FJ972_19120 [Mesorhizobium sp. B2-1-1]
MAAGPAVVNSGGSAAVAIVLAAEKIFGVKIDAPKAKVPSASANPAAPSNGG